MTTAPCFAGYRRASLQAQVGIRWFTGSPIGLTITDPDGFTITPETFTVTSRELLREVPSQLYYIVDANHDDEVIAPTLKRGIYLVKPVPRADALLFGYLQPDSDHR